MQKAFKRWMKATAILFAVMLIGANTGLAQVTVSLGEVTGRPGETVTVPVDISGVEGGTDIISYGFDVAVSNPDISFTGISTTGTLTGNAQFQVALNGTTIGAAFAFGSAITSSGNLINLNFNLNAVASGTVTLTGFEFNDGDPAVAGGDPSNDYTVATRLVGVGIEHERRLGEAYTNTNQLFKILVNVEDALVEGDGVVSFGFTLHYDPAFITILNASLAGGLFDGGLVTTNDDGNGTILVGGAASGVVTGNGLLLTMFATAGPNPGSPELDLDDFEWNTGDPIYGTRDGVALILPFNVANEDEAGLPTEFTLKGNYPNPFNPSTTIQFDLPETANVTVTVMDLLGRQVLAVPTQSMSAGANKAIQIQAGSLSSGIYLYRVLAQTQLNTSVKVGSMTLLK